MNISDAARELKPCPFCGGGKISMAAEMHDGLYAVQCQTCYAGGPQHSSKRRARIDWNRRDATATAALTLELETVRRELEFAEIAKGPFVDVSAICEQRDKAIEERDQLRQQLAEAREDSTLWSKLEALLSPGTCLRLILSDSRDMGYKENFLSVSIQNAGQGLGSSIREAMKATLNPPTDEK